MTLSKICLQCNKVFYKSVTRSLKHWSTAKYCSHKCGSIGKHNKLGKIGYKLSEETKRKISKNHRNQWGDKNSSWRGGKSFEKYTIDWTKTLRQAIRERDKYTCQICKEKQGEISLDVHHIDYNKKNCDPNNLISLCHSCHMRTNGSREKWKNYFKSNGI